jgi:hypothetical protein
LKRRIETEDILKLIRNVSIALLSLSFLAGPLHAESAKLNTSLKFLRHARATGLAKADDRRPALAAARADKITVTAKFDHVLSDAEIAFFEQQGADFFRVDGAVSHTGPVYAVSIPWDAVDAVAARGDVLKIDAAWRPAVFPVLDVSAHEIEADSAWRRIDPLGIPLTGKGMRISDFDTGIDVFHRHLQLDRLRRGRGLHAGIRLRGSQRER